MVLRDYTPQRRRVMELVMCGLLAVAIALAALVTRSANRAHRLELSPQTFTHENITVRLPLQWRAQEGDPGDPRVMAQATEPAPRGAQPRVVRVLVDRIERPMSPLRYLREAFGVRAPGDDVVFRAIDGDVESVFEAADIGGHSAVLIGVHRLDPEEEEVFQFRNDIYVAVVLPSLQVIVVHLSGSDRIDAEDESIARQIAAAIDVADPAAPDPPRTVITLSPGIQLQPPAGFLAVQKRDANRSDRLFWQFAAQPAESLEELEGNWSSIEVVGCYFAHRERDRARATVQTLLLTRDRMWRDGKVSESGGAWRAERGSSRNRSIFPARAYLIPDRSDRALLVIFRGGFGGGGAFDRLWKELEKTVRFLPAADVGQLESIGATEGRRLLRAPIIAELPGERAEQWWLHTGPGNRPHIGWSRLRWNEGGRIAATSEMRLRSFGGDVITRIVSDFTLGAGPRQYTSDTTRTETRIHGPHTLTQIVNLQRGQLTIGVRVDTSAATEFKMPAPPQYIPAGVLPMLIGQLDPGPLLVRTDGFIDCPAVGAPEPLAVIIRPGVNRTRKADGEETPMRCVTAEVNGSGRVTRWYFRQSGELELIELPGGVTLTPSTAKAIHFAFGQSGPMTP